jgi:hypothetical protein
VEICQPQNHRTVEHVVTAAYCLSIAIKNSTNFRLSSKPCEEKQPQQPHFRTDACLGTRRPLEAEIMEGHGAGRGAGHHGGFRHSAGSCAGGFAECAAGPGLRRCYSR